MTKELPGGAIDLIILALLAEGESYGYALAKTIRERGASTHQIGEGTLYGSLKRLSSKGLLESRWGDSEEGGRRKYYRLSELGKTELKDRAADWSTTASLVSSCLKTRFGQGGVS